MPAILTVTDLPVNGLRIFLRSNMISYLQYLFVNFYCMDIPAILQLLLFATVGFWAIYRWHREKWWIRISVAAILLCWIAIVIYVTVGDRTGNRTMQVNLIPFHSYREVLSGGNPEILRSNFMNAVLFYPAGLLATALLPEKWPGWSRCVLVVLLFAALSAGIEYVQYTYALGRCEIDDVIHNTAGALAGSLAVLLMPSLLVWLSDNVKRMWEQYDYYRK